MKAELHEFSKTAKKLGKFSGLIGCKGLKSLDFVKSPDDFFRPETGNDGNSQKSTQKWNRALQLCQRSILW